MWNVLSRPPVAALLQLRQGATNQRFVACMRTEQAEGARGQHRSARRPKAEDERVDAGEEAATRFPVTAVVAASLLLDDVPGLGGSGNRHNDVRESLSSQFGHTQVVAPESARL